LDDQNEIKPALGSDDLLAALEPGSPAVPTHRFPVEGVPLHGGRLCLDFTYTAVWRATPRPDETLVDYSALLAFSTRTGTLRAHEEARLAEVAEAHPDEAAAVVARAVDLREALYRVFLAQVAGRSPRQPDLDRFNAELAEAMARATVHPDDEGFAWDWTSALDEPDAASLASPLWPIARSAADLLTSPDLARVKRCPGEGCGWLFLDTSKNGSRRWCDMAGCGNRARVRAFAARRRAGRAAGTAIS
jgi:predicted RNA-binding Zn ribbon-like protein